MQSVNIPFRIRTLTGRYKSESTPSSRFLRDSLLRDDFTSRLHNRAYASPHLISLPTGNRDCGRASDTADTDNPAQDRDTQDAANNQPVVDLSESPGIDAINTENSVLAKRKRKQTAAVLQAAEQHARPLKGKSKKMVSLELVKPEESRPSLASYLAGDSAFEEHCRQLISSSSPILRCCCLTTVTTGTSLRKTHFNCMTSYSFVLRSISQPH